MISGFFIGFFVGGFIGIVVGIAIMAMLAVGKEADERIEKTYGNT